MEVVPGRGRVEGRSRRTPYLMIQTRHVHYFPTVDLTLSTYRHWTEGPNTTITRLSVELSSPLIRPRFLWDIPVKLG